MQAITEITAGTNADEAFEARVAEQYLGLLRLAVLLAGNQADGEDAVQVALERAWRSRGALRDTRALEQWLRKIVVREVVRRQTSPWARLGRAAAPVDLAAIPAAAPDRELRLMLARALSRLSAEQRAAIVLHHYSGYPVTVVAEIVGAPPETVRSRLRLGMVRLRKEFER